MEKQKIKQEMDKKLMEQRAKFVEKAKKISLLDPDGDEKPRKSGSKVRAIYKYMYIDRQEGLIILISFTELFKVIIIIFSKVMWLGEF